MELDEGPDDEVPSYRVPLPPSDRLWRHPSEVSGTEATSAFPVRSRRGRPSWLIGALGGVAGACAAVGIMAAFGMLDHKVVERLVVEREAVVPAVAAGTIPASSLASVVEDATPAVARIEVGGLIGSASGSGVLYRNDGYLITNAHVVSDATTINVVLADGSQHAGTLVGADADSDIAVVKIDGDGYPSARLGDSKTLQVGQPAIAIGSPLGLEGGPSATVGVISALGRTVETHGGDAALTGMIQTDASIAAGSSGGGLFDASGTLIGITTAVAITESGTEGLGFAIPAEEARRVAQDLVTNGKVVRVWLGVRGADMASGAEQVHGTEGGAMLREVVEGGPAAAAGLASGDVVTRIGDTDVSSMSGLVMALRSHRPGETVPVTYVRDGQSFTVDVVLAEKP